MTIQPAIPASYTAGVAPGVISAGGTAIDLLGMGLSASTRIPIGTVQSFATAAAVQAFFGAGSPEALFAAVYFQANDDKTKTPDALLLTQYPTAAVPAYLRSGVVSGLTLAQLQALTGVITMTIDGQSFTSSAISLSSATSFSSAAGLIQTGLAANDAVVTAAVAVGNASVTGSIAGTVLTVTAVGSGSLFPGQVLSGTSVTSGTTILAQLTGATAGQTGTYSVSVASTASSTTITATGTGFGLMTVSAVASGTLAIGQVITGSGVVAGTKIVQLLTGTGGTGIYVVNNATVVSSTTITSGVAQVTYDSQSGSFIITGGTPGATGSITFATGSLAAGLMLTAVTGAVLSQGAAAATPNAFMTTLLTLTIGWFTFTTIGFKPVVADMVSFAGWCSLQNDNYAYVMWDTDITVTTNSDTTSAGYQIITNDDSGVFMIYEPTNLLGAALVMGTAAAIDFTRTNGRRNFKFVTQSGLVPGVTSQTIAAQLTANGYNYYGANANATNLWNFIAEGSVTGPFTWFDSYCNQRWLNSSLQTALITLLTSVPSIPFNPAGATLIAAACTDPINAAINFGAIRQNVTLSAAQAAEVNAAAGLTIDPILSSVGWYLQVIVPPAAVRVARGPWPITLWFQDGESVNRINLSSLLVQ